MKKTLVNLPESLCVELDHIATDPTYQADVIARDGRAYRSYRGVLIRELLWVGLQARYEKSQT